MAKVLRWLSRSVGLLFNKLGGYQTNNLLLNCEMDKQGHNRHIVCLHCIFVFTLAPPTNLTVEIKSDYIPSKFIDKNKLNQTVNCTATMNPNTTIFFLFGQKSISSSEYLIASNDSAETYVISNNSNGCYPNVRTVFTVDVDFIELYPLLGCLAYDTVYGKNFSSDKVTATFIIIT